jgi:hypothetical protein
VFHEFNRRQQCGTMSTEKTGNYSSEYNEQREDDSYLPGSGEPEVKMGVGRYLATRFSTLYVITVRVATKLPCANVRDSKPPMDKVEVCLRLQHLNAVPAHLTDSPRTLLPFFDCSTPSSGCSLPSLSLPGPGMPSTSSQSP